MQITKSESSLTQRERVMHYLNAEFLRPGKKNGTKLPAVRQIARQLGVSASTCQQVLSELNATGRVRTRVGDGTYLEGSSRAGNPFRIAVNASPEALHESAPWTSALYNGIIGGIAASSGELVMSPLDLSRNGEDDILRFAENDALILISSDSPINRRVQEAFKKQGKPVVTINPPEETACTNFVSAEVYRISRQLGEAWNRVGKKHVVYLNAWLDFESSVSGSQKFAGLAVGLQRPTWKEITLRVVHSGNLRFEDGYNGMRQYIAEHDAPDAVYAFSQWQADGALAALRDEGISVPEQCSVVCGNVLPDHMLKNPGMTRMNQPLQEIARNAVAMAKERLLNEGKDVPGRYFDSQFAGGETTSKAENEILGLK